METIYTDRLSTINQKIKKNLENIIDVSRTIKNCTQAQIITFLINNTNKSIYQKDICEALKLKKSSITEQLDYLQTKEIIERIVDGRDRRKNRIKLTEQSMERIKEIHRTIYEYNNNLIKGISEEELKCFIGVLDKIEMNMKGKYEVNI